MDTVKIGIVGLGTMGLLHGQNILGGKVPRCELTAVCDPNVERLKQTQSAEAFVGIDDFLRESRDGRDFDRHPALLSHRHRDSGT